MKKVKFMDVKDGNEFTYNGILYKKGCAAKSTKNLDDPDDNRTFFGDDFLVEVDKK